MNKIGVLSFSDGRERVHESLRPGIEAEERKLAAAIRALGFDPVCAEAVSWRPRQAVAAAKRLLAEDVGGVVFNLPVFAFPNLPLLAADVLQLPVALVSPGEAGLPGMGGMLAAAGGLESCGHWQTRIWGPLDDPAIRRRLAAFLRAASALHRLRGQVYGQFGGRSIGMITGVASSPILWHRLFGVDADHVDQGEILRRAALVPAAERERVVSWFESHLGAVRYAEGGKLTRETLLNQVACAVAVKQIVAEREFDFIGIKCHYDLSEYHCTQCLSAAFLPSRLDWDGEREPMVCACEADGDGALTMQILQLVGDAPALFMDLRHYDRGRNLWTLCNCGGQSVAYAPGDSHAETLRQVELVPVIPKYGGNGAHVRYLGAPGLLTLARFMHDADGPVLLVCLGEAVAADPAWMEQSCPAWPHLYVRIGVDADELLNALHANHIHAVGGDVRAELANVASMAGLRCRMLGDDPSVEGPKHGMPFPGPKPDSL
jgi:L-fucose isomerase